MATYDTGKARLAGSLKILFREIDALWPNRSRSIDGWIGDKAHQARKSDHNPDSRGIVHAIDITASGTDTSYVISRVARGTKPTAYVIFNHRIWSRKTGFAPRAYTGSNHHHNHIHVSILYGVQFESDKWTWDIADLGAIDSAPAPPAATGEFNDWRGLFDGAGGRFDASATVFSQAAQSISSLRG